MRVFLTSNLMRTGSSTVYHTLSHNLVGSKPKAIYEPETLNVMPYNNAGGHLPQDPETQQKQPLSLTVNREPTIAQHIHRMRPGLP